MEQWFYHNEALKEGQELDFTGQEHAHMAKSLRLKEGDSVAVCNGKGQLFGAVVLSVSRRETQVQLQEVLEEQRENTNRGVIAIAPTKNASRFEWFLEKATECGIRSIQPIYTRHSIRRNLKLDRCARIVQSAAMQSKALYIPELREPLSFIEFVNGAKPDGNYIAVVENDGNLLSDESLSSDAAVCIGPEGGFHAEEIETAKRSGFKMVSLGRKRLRAETAGVVASVLLNL